MAGGRYRYTGWHACFKAVPIPATGSGEACLAKRMYVYIGLGFLQAGKQFAANSKARFGWSGLNGIELEAASGSKPEATASGKWC